MGNLSPFYDTFYWAISETWPMLTLFVVIMTVLKLTRVIINHDRFIFYKEFYSLLFIIYILLLYFLLLSTENLQCSRQYCIIYSIWLFCIRLFKS